MKAKNIVQFIKYNIGGMLYFVFAWTVITYFTDDIGLFWTNIIGNALGIIANYLVQRYWTFAGGPNVFSSGWKFAVLTIINLGISYLILSFLTDTIDIGIGWAQIVSSLFFTGWNWAWYRYWVFRKK